MPRCYKCDAPIIFMTPEPTPYNPKPKSIPLDVAPSSIGTVSLYEMPGKIPGAGTYAVEANKRPRKMFMRRHSGAALDYMRRNPAAALYRVHFDTCPNRRK
jgi:hypothetical protein